MSNSVWVVTYINDMDLVSQDVYTDYGKAIARERELHKSLYENWFNQHRDDFGKDDTFMDFQFSSCWNDLDSKVVVHFYKASLE